MAEVLAAAHPEKRLFISLITRDISLIDAFLDIVDNSINAALAPLAAKLKTASDYHRVLTNPKTKPTVTIHLTISDKMAKVTDDAAGISLKTAREHVFKFGRTESESDDHDRLSVYGIGLKRAMFKLGNRVSMTSDYRLGGFSLNLDVSEWEKATENPWTFKIEPRAASKKTGTEVAITELYDSVRRRITDGLFLEQLKEKIARTYAFFIGRIVEITVNGKRIERELFEIGENFANENFQVGDVSCSVTAGIAATKGDLFRDKNAGWFVFCNGRTVLAADKTTLTGWGNAGLPIFQPKHRPFLGIVFFVSPHAESLPWNTTKSSVNEDSTVWQQAKRHMVNVGRSIITFLDRRYTSEGTDIPANELQGETSAQTVSVFAATVSPKKTFEVPKKTKLKEIRVQYDAKVTDIERISKFVGKAMNGSQVGRYTFQYFLKNVLGTEE